MIKTRHWVMAGTAAVSLQVLAFMYSEQFQQDGAKNKGEQGIEIDLGMLGELGEAQQTNEPEKQTAEPVEVQPVEKTVTEPEVIEPTPVKAVTKNTPVQEKQQSEIKVTKQVVVKEPILQKWPTEPAQVEAKPVQPINMATKVNKSDSTTQSAQQKQTTGQANALSTGGKPAINQSYFSQLAATLAKHKRYPVSSRRRGEEGIVKLHFVVDRSGKVLEFHISESSGSKQLDDAVIKMLKKAQPLPSFPAEMTMPQLEVNVPIAFQLNTS